VSGPAEQIVSGRESKGWKSNQTIWKAWTLSLELRNPMTGYQTWPHSAGQQI